MGTNWLRLALNLDTSVTFKPTRNLLKLMLKSLKFILFVGSLN